MKERIQKLLARAGYGSRREIERWIIAGDIKVNGALATTGQPISAQDTVVLRGRALNLSARLHATPRVLVYHKKAGEICTMNDPESRPTVFDNLPKVQQGRWVMIGRLDINTDGLLLFTTDGELANRLMHPSREIEREYASRILGEVDADMLKRLQKGVELEDGSAKFIRIKDAGGEGANHWYHVVLAEGRNREVRRLWESQGVKVSRLIRIRYGNIQLPRYLRAGHSEELDTKAMHTLYQSVDMVFEDGSQPNDNNTGPNPNNCPSHKDKPRGRTQEKPRSGPGRKAPNPYANASKKLSGRTGSSLKNKPKTRV